MRGRIVAVGVIAFLLVGMVTAMAGEGPFPPTPEQQKALTLVVKDLVRGHVYQADPVVMSSLRVTHPTPQQQTNLTVVPRPVTYTQKSAHCWSAKVPVEAQALGFWVLRYTQQLSWCENLKGTKITSFNPNNHSCSTAWWSMWVCSSWTPIVGPAAGTGATYAYVRGEFVFSAYFQGVPITQYHFAAVTGQLGGRWVPDWN